MTVKKQAPKAMLREWSNTPSPKPALQERHAGRRGAGATREEAGPPSGEIPPRPSRVKTGI